VPFVWRWSKIEYGSTIERRQVANRFIAQPINRVTLRFLEKREQNRHAQRRPSYGPFIRGVF